MRCFLVILMLHLIPYIQELYIRIEFPLTLTLSILWITYIHFVVNTCNHSNILWNSSQLLVLEWKQSNNFMKCISKVCLWTRVFVYPVANTRRVNLDWHQQFTFYYCAILLRRFLLSKPIELYTSHEPKHFSNLKHIFQWRLVVLAAVATSRNQSKLCMMRICYNAWYKHSDIHIRTYNIKIFYIMLCVLPLISNVFSEVLKSVEQYKTFPKKFSYVKTKSFIYA